MTIHLVKLDPRYLRSMAEVRERVRAWRVGRARVGCVDEHAEEQTMKRLGSEAPPKTCYRPLGSNAVPADHAGPILVRPSRHDWRDHAGPFIWAGVMFLGALAWCLAPVLIAGVSAVLAGPAVLVRLLVLLDKA